MPVAEAPRLGCRAHGSECPLVLAAVPIWAPGYRFGRRGQLVTFVRRAQFVWSCTGAAEAGTLGLAGHTVLLTQEPTAEH